MRTSCNGNGGTFLLGSLGLRDAKSGHLRGVGQNEDCKR
jgi:hypothetical protein